MVQRGPRLLTGGVPDQLPVLNRPREGAVIGGVCAALAQRLGIEAKVLRIVAVVTAIAFSGLGIALYIAGLLLIPRVGEQYGPLAKAIPAVRSWPRGLLAALVVTGSVAVTWGSGGGPVLVPVVVVGVIVWFTVFRNRHRSRTTTVPEPTPFERAADAWRVRLAEQEVPGFEKAALQQRWEQPYTDPSDQLVSDQPTPLPVVARKRSWRLWAVALVLIGVGTLTVAVLGIAGWPATSLAYASAVLAALGITGLLAARLGRPPLFLLATIIAAVVMLTQLAPNPGSMELNSAITDPAKLPASYELAAGEVDLDLSNLALTEDRNLSIKVGAGDVRVKLPRAASSELSWKVGVGEATVPDHENNGLSLTGSQLVGTATSGPTLHLAIEVGAGDLEVT
jgi:phage shock protein PspC (stress-responsive transcriptional regulator)